MKKKVFIIHRWHGNPKLDWYQWIKKELEKRNFEVIVPEMPNTDSPIIKDWVDHLKKLIINLNEKDFFIAHSIGCQTVMRFLSIHSEKEKLGGIIFVAPWLKLKNLPKEEIEIAKPWLENPIDFKKIKSFTNKITCIFSDNDNYVPIENITLFRKNLNAEIITEKDKGHFSEDDGIKKVPEVLEKFLKISNGN